MAGDEHGRGGAEDVSTGPELGLAAAWKAGDMNAFMDAFEAALRRGAPPRAIERASAEIAEGERAPFTRALFGLADTKDAVLVLPDGRSADAELSVFAFAAQGPEGAFGAALRQPMAEGLAGLVRSSGLAHPRSTVVLCPATIGIDAASGMDPHGVRRLAEDLFAAIAPGARPDAPLPGRDASSPPWAPAAESGAASAVRLFVGGRLLVYGAEDAWAADAFGVPEVGKSPEEDDAAIAAHEREKARAEAAFREGAKAFALGHGLRMVFDAPTDWAAAISSMGLLHAQSLLSLEAAAENRALDAGLDAHYAVDGGGALLVAVRDARSRYGPVELPAAVAEWGIDLVVGWLRGRFRSVTRHGAAEALRGALGARSLN